MPPSGSRQHYATYPVILPQGMPRPTITGAKLERYKQAQLSRTMSPKDRPKGMPSGSGGELGSSSPETGELWCTEEDLLYIPPRNQEIEDAADPMFPSPHQFNTMVAIYLKNLSPKKREKALLTQKMYDSVMQVLHDPKNTHTKTAQFRFWAKKMFALTGFGDENVICHENKPVAVKEQIYEVLVHCHQQAGHGGRDKTSAQVRKYYSWIPKEIIARFVRDCPFCQTRRTQSSAGIQMTESQAFLISLQSSDAQGSSKRPVSLAEARADAMRFGHKPYRRPSPRSLNGTEGQAGPSSHYGSSSIPYHYQHPGQTQSHVGPVGRQQLEHQSTHMTADGYVHYNEPMDTGFQNTQAESLQWGSQGYDLTAQNLLPVYPGQVDPNFVMPQQSGFPYGYTMQQPMFQQDPQAAPRRSGSFEEISSQEILNIQYLAEEAMYRRASEPVGSGNHMYNPGLGIFESVAEYPAESSIAAQAGPSMLNVAAMYDQHNVPRNPLVKVESPQSSSPSQAEAEATFQQIGLYGRLSDDGHGSASQGSTYLQDTINSEGEYSRPSSAMGGPDIFDVDHTYNIDQPNIYYQDSIDVAYNNPNQYDPNFELHDYGLASTDSQQDLPVPAVENESYENNAYHDGFTYSFSEPTAQSGQPIESPPEMKIEEYDQLYAIQGQGQGGFGGGGSSQHPYATNGNGLTVAPTIPVSAGHSRESTITPRGGSSTEAPQPSTSFWNDKNSQGNPHLRA